MTCLLRNSLYKIWTVHAVKCPRCKSAEVIFLERDGELKGNSAFDARFKWTCDLCGHEWEDDGIEQKA
jgi:transposase-like protein